MSEITVLLPGGFKPPHGGHLELANKFASRDDVESVVVLVGPLEREGITRQQSMKVWNLLPTNKKVSVISTKENNPMNAAFNYVFSLPKDSSKMIALGSSSKDAADSKRSLIFKKAVERYKEKPDKFGNTSPKGIEVTDITDDVYSVYSNRSDELNNKSISATTLRNDLKEKDFNNFKTNYPGVSDTVTSKIYKILSGSDNKSELDERLKKCLEYIIRTGNF
jgi:hypothetical protein